VIIKASQRSGGKQLGQHLLKTEENEHVEVHEISGFVSNTILGAMQEAYALSRGTKCDQYLFSVSLNPPVEENVHVETFEHALRMIEERNGLEGQPRIVVFHEKEGRRHCHAVWSRIDAAKMTAKPLPFFKTKLRDIGRQLFLENGWKMPAGYSDSKLRDPRSFSLEEWQRAKRAQVDPRELKAAVQEAWAVSDNRNAFVGALEERGLFLARGDRRAHVAVTLEGEVFAISRCVGIKAKDVAARLGEPENLPSVGETVDRLRGEVGAKLRLHIAEARRIATAAMTPLREKKDNLRREHQAARAKLDRAIGQRAAAEQTARQARIRRGIMGVWDIMTGRYFRVRKQNELEAQFARERDRTERQALIAKQLKERQALQTDIKALRTRHATQILALYKQSVHYRDHHYRQRRESTRGRSRSASLDLG
jgi:hypothetical protein